MQKDAILKSDLREISYQEFGDILADLEIKVKISGIKFDLIVPILRSGAFTGMHLASKLRISNILPAQYKYEFNPSEVIVKKIEFPVLNFRLSESPVVLVCDSNTVYGSIAKRVIHDVRKLYPNSKIYFASANLDQSIKNLPGVEKIFYGRLSNERRGLSKVESERKSVTNDLIIFPWENLDEQWLEIKGS